MQRIFSDRLLILIQFSRLYFFLYIMQLNSHFSQFAFTTANKAQKLMRVKKQCSGLRFQQRFCKMYGQIRVSLVCNIHFPFKKMENTLCRNQSLFIINISTIVLQILCQNLVSHTNPQYYTEAKKFFHSCYYQCLVPSHNHIPIYYIFRYLNTVVVIQLLAIFY